MDPAARTPLDGVSRAALFGLMLERAEDCVAAAQAAADRAAEPRGERPRERERLRARDPARWTGVLQAVDAAREGRVPAHAADEPPRWLEAVVRGRVGLCATVTTRGGDMAVVRVLEVLGAVHLEHDDAYVLALVGGLDGCDHLGLATRADALRSDLELLGSTFWRIFEVEGGGEVSLANVDKFSTGRDSWSATMQELVGDGTLGRHEVLEACLAALTRDFSAYRAGWFSRLYASLRATPDESAGFQRALRGLLRSRVSATAALAVRELRAVSRRGLLDDEPTVEALAAALQGDVAATAGTAVRLLEEIARRRPDLAAAVAGPAAVGLGHRDRQVQARAAALLRQVGAETELAGRAVELAPAVAAGLDLRGTADASVAVTAGPAHAEPVHPLGRRPVPAAPGADLLDRVAALLEDASDPLEIEAVLDGLSRVGPTDALRSLDRRAAAILGSGPRDGVTPGWVRGQVARLVRLSCGAAVPPLEWRQDPRSRPGREVTARFLGRRFDEVGDVLRGVLPPGPTVAVPEQAEGWIGPESLVRRLAGAPAPRHDVVAALLRLAPEGRAEALALARRELADLRGRRPAVAAATEYALGGAAPRYAPWTAMRLDDEGRALWTAAARARHPLAVDPWARRLGLTGAGRADPLDLRLDVPEPWPARARPGAAPPERRGLPWIDVRTLAPAVPDDQPTALVGGTPWLEDDLEDYVPWLATLWPADAEHLSWLGAPAVVESAAGGRLRHDAARVLVALGAHPGRIGRLSAAVLAVGLGSVRADERIRAADAVHRLATSGRLTAGGLAAGLVDVGPATVLGRVAAGLADVAAIDAASSEFVVAVLGEALPDVPPGTRGLSSALQLLLDEVLRYGRRTPAGLRPWLGRLEGTSQAARAASRLADALEPDRT